MLFQEYVLRISGGFLFGGDGEHRDLHYPLRRQRQMGRRDSGICEGLDSRSLVVGVSGGHYFDFKSHFIDIIESWFFPACPI